MFHRARFRASLLVLLAFAPFSLRAQSDPPRHKTRAYLHGRIYTNDPQHPWAAALAVRDGKVFCIGSLAHVLLECNAGHDPEETVDLHGAFVMPGFNDSHVHLGGAGAALLSVRLNGAMSPSEMQERVGAAVKMHQAGEWITGAGWDHTLWPEKKFPNRQQLDSVAPENPAFFVHVSGHVGVANSLALRLAGISKDSPNPAGGEIERDASGEPTGMLKEGAAMELLRSRIPPPSPEQRRKGIELALADVAKNGVTSIQDNSLVEAIGNNTSTARGKATWDDFLVYRQLKNEGKLTARITEWLPFAAPLDRLITMRRDGGTTDPWLRTGALKMVTDGAMGSRTAAMLAPFSDDPSTSGILTMEPDKLRELAIERDRAGFQLAFHAIGDRANRIALDVFEAVAQANGPRDRRSRIEHAQVVAPEDFARFAKLSVIASMQPSHETNDMRWAEQRVGPDRAKGSYSWASMQKAGARLAFGTDYPVEPVSPMRGLYACVTRELPEGGPAGGWQPQEKISLEDCIRAYTSGSAYAEFMEGKKGELKPGEFADFIVLSADLTKIPPSQFSKTRVLRTVVGGRTMYQETK
jgi:predicted amidohydrolase YtcJ